MARTPSPPLRWQIGAVVGGVDVDVTFLVVAGLDADGRVAAAGAFGDRASRCRRPRIADVLGHLDLGRAVVGVDGRPPILMSAPLSWASILMPGRLTARRFRRRNDQGGGSGEGAFMGGIRVFRSASISARAASASPPFRATRFRVTWAFLPS